MQFGLNEEQRLFQDTAARWLAESHGEAAPAVFDAALWEKMALMGWLGAGFAEELGGSGGGITETAILLEEAGRALMPEPLLELAVMAPHLVAAIAPDRLEGIFEGRLSATVAWMEHGRSDPFAPDCRLTGGGLRGTKVQVSAAAEAEVLLVLARDEQGQPAIASVAPGADGVLISPRRQLDGRIAATVVFSDARADVLADGARALEAFADAFDHTLAAACAEALGIASGMFDRTLDYARTRVQFGRPIAEFQVIQHRLADAHIAIEEARSLTTMACKTLDDLSAGERRAPLSAAKVGVVARCLAVAREAIQLHGGVGMTEELPVGRGFRRLRALAVLYGDEAWHLARVRP